VTKSVETLDVAWVDINDNHLSTIDLLRKIFSGGKIAAKEEKSKTST